GTVAPHAAGRRRRLEPGARVARRGRVRTAVRRRKHALLRAGACPVRTDLATLHEAIAARKRDDPCFIAPDRTYSWREVTDRSRRIADLLRSASLGLHPDLVAPRGPTHTAHRYLALLRRL